MNPPSAALSEKLSQHLLDLWIETFSPEIFILVLGEWSRIASSFSNIIVYVWFVRMWARVVLKLIIFLEQVLMSRKL